MCSRDPPRPGGPPTERTDTSRQSGRSAPGWSMKVWMLMRQCERSRTSPDLTSVGRARARRAPGSRDHPEHRRPGRGAARDGARPGADGSDVERRRPLDVGALPAPSSEDPSSMSIDQSSVAFQPAGGADEGRQGLFPSGQHLRTDSTPVANSSAFSAFGAADVAQNRTLSAASITISSASADTSWRCRGAEVEVEHRLERAGVPPDSAA